MSSSGVATVSRSRRPRDLDLEQANHAATPCNMVKKNENNAANDGSKGSHPCEQRQLQTKHKWKDARDGDDKNRVQVTNDERDDANDSQALSQVVTSRGTKGSRVMKHLPTEKNFPHNINR